MSIDDLPQFLKTKHFDYKIIEEQIREYWKINETFRLDIEEFDIKDITLIDTPPPYANGALHHGHGMSYTQLDIIARYHRIQGPTLLPLAFDDNGLPTERYTEKKYQIEPGLHPDNFFELCKKEALEGIKIQQDQFDVLGFSYNHEIAYRTIDDRSIRLTQEDFLKLYEGGNIIRQKEPQLYCTHCQTALAQADLENENEKSFMHYIEFPSNSDTEPILIGTTRPELIPAAAAIFYHPDDDRFEYTNLQIQNPITGEIIPIISDERVDLDQGSGTLMCATFGDLLDIELYREYDLPNKSIIDSSGLITHGNYRGLSIKDARSRIIEDLKNQGYFHKSEMINHTIPTCERCSTPMEIIESEQWSLDILSIKQELLDYIDGINFHPSHMKKRLINWIKGLKWNWTISRQRYYGIPIPMYHCNSCNHIFTAEKSEIPILPNNISSKTCENCGKTASLDPDIFDTWMSSSLTPRILADRYFGGDLNQPLALRSQAHEIIRTWAFYTILKQYLSGDNQTIPWNNLLISGWGLGFKGKGKRGVKASKSSGSGMDPREIIQEYGADAFRYWAGSAKWGKDQYLLDATLNRGKKLTTKLFNAGKITFILLYDTETSSDTNDDLIDQFTSRLESLGDAYHNFMQEFHSADALAKLEDTFWNGYCSIDIEDLKSKAYDQGLSSKEKEVLRSIWSSYLKLFAPYLPFITEFLAYLTWQFEIQDTKANSSGRGNAFFPDYISIHSTPSNFKKDQ